MTDPADFTYRTEGHVALFVVNGVDVLAEPRAVDGLRGTLEHFEEDSELRVFAILCADSPSAERPAKRGARLADLSINRPAKPVVAGIASDCVGLGLAVLGSVADIRVGAVNAMYGFGATSERRDAGLALKSRLYAQVPYTSLMMMILAGSPIDASEAVRIGLLNEAVLASDVIPRAKEIAALIATVAPAAIRADKTGATRAADLPFEDALFLGSAFATLNRMGPDLVEGVEAFLQKRQPRFRGL
jgi:enoyl-CoA hydratase